MTTRRNTPCAPLSCLRLLRSRSRSAASGAPNTTATATAIATAAPRLLLALLPLELLFAVAALLSNRSLVALARTSRSMQGMLCELLYERFKSSTVWWQTTAIIRNRNVRGPLVEIGPVQWATTHRRKALLERLLGDMDVLPPPLLRDLQGSSPLRIGRWEAPALLTRAALSGDEDVMCLLLARARNIPDVDVATPLKHCANERIFRLLADEGSRRLKGLGLG